MKSLLIIALMGLVESTALGQTEVQTVATEASFRGLSVVSAKVAWASGTKGTIARTTDGGKTWAAQTVPDADKLDFRDVEAFSETTAYILSAGPGPDSRIYKTSDGGKTWALQFKNAEPEGFLDAIAFWDDRNGIALGIGSRFRKRAFPWRFVMKVPSPRAGHAWSPADEATSGFARAAPRTRECFIRAIEAKPGSRLKLPSLRVWRPRAVSRLPSAIRTTE
jgi:hypothetical protein